MYLLPDPASHDTSLRDILKDRPNAEWCKAETMDSQNRDSPTVGLYESLINQAEVIHQFFGLGVCEEGGRPLSTTTK